MDAETRYVFIEKLCLCLYYACTKLRHYLLSSTCIVTCQTDVIKHMLQRPILSGRIGKWVYTLIEYDLAYESLKSMKGQVVVDFIVDHHVNVAYDNEVYLLSTTPWKLYFDGSSCKERQGIGVVLFSPNGSCFETSVRLEYPCTDNQAEYDALLFGLQVLESIGATHVKAFGDSELIVQQVAGVYKCFDGSLNRYLDQCLDIIANFDDFVIRHIARGENSRANNLAQQASSYHVKRGIFLILEKLVLEFKSLGEIGKRSDQGWSDRRDMAGLTEDQGRSDRCSMAGLTGSQGRSDRQGVTGLTDVQQETGGHGTSQDSKAELIENSDICAQDIEEDWRIPLINYLKNPSLRIDRKIRRQAFKYILLDGELYRRNIDGVLLKCLDNDQSKVAMGEVHEGICGTHQSAHKMNWLLRRAGFYWPKMIDDCFKYYRGCEACQRFGIVQLATCCRVESYHKNVAVPRLGFRFHRSNSSFVIQGTSVRASCNGLFYQVGRSRTVEEYDSHRGN